MGINNESQITVPLLENNEESNNEIELIKHEENNHFTQTKVLFIIINFVSLFTTQSLFGSKANAGSPPLLPPAGRYAVFVIFIIV